MVRLPGKPGTQKNSPVPHSAADDRDTPPPPRTFTQYSIEAVRARAFERVFCAATSRRLQPARVC